MTNADLDSLMPEPVAYRVQPRHDDSDGYFDFTDKKEIAEELQHRGWTITPLCTADQMREAMRRVLAAQWRPIESAPRDTDVLVVEPNGFISNAAFIKNAMTKRYLWWRPCVGVMAQQPTHWMPLPPPPTTHQQKDKQ